MNSHWTRQSVAIGVSLVLASFCVMGAQSPDEEYLQIYSTIQKADAIAATDSAEASRKYQEAYAALEKFQGKYPNWRRSAVDFRLQFLRSRIESPAGSTSTNSSSGEPAAEAERSAPFTNEFAGFIGRQQKRTYNQVPREVLAFYYGWYRSSGSRNAWGTVHTNRKEISKSARYPVKGAYSSHDRDVVAWHIDQAKAAGITGFIVSWWGTSEWESWHSQSLALVIRVAEEKNFKVSIYWEQAPGSGNGQINRAVNELSQVLKEHGTSKAFLKVNGHPVVFAYNRVVSFQVPATSWPAIIEGVRRRAGDFVLIADGYQHGWARMFDGVHWYGFQGMPNDLERRLADGRLGDLREWAANTYASAVDLARQNSRISCLLVMPGIDSRKAYNFDWEMDRLGGKTYQVFWEEAVKANPDWILITSWNEWPEGTEIEPSVELGDLYLKLTAQFAKPFVQLPPAKITTPSLTPPPAQNPDFNRLLDGRSVAVLAHGEVEDVEFWAASAGAKLQRLEWKDLVDPRRFNATNFPILLHLAYEHYTSTIKTQDDVIAALIRYLHEGGILMCLPPASPWPLHYDDSRNGAPFSITDRLGMGVDNGFEKVPQGVELKFHARTEYLRGLPVTAPFPVQGDVRWRPSVRGRVSPLARYTPLVQLKGSDGRNYGEAAVYIEHRAAPIAPGKVIYVWMRTAEAIGPEKFYPALFEFVSTKVKPRQPQPVRE